MVIMMLVIPKTVKMTMMSMLITVVMIIMILMITAIVVKQIMMVLIIMTVNIVIKMTKMVMIISDDDGHGHYEDGDDCGDYDAVGGGGAGVGDKWENKQIDIIINNPFNHLFPLHIIL